MSTNFPSSLDNNTNLPPVNATDPENSAGKEHDVIHTTIHAALLAIENKLGIDGSGLTSTVDYLLKNTLLTKVWDAVNNRLFTNDPTTGHSHDGTNSALVDANTANAVRVKNGGTTVGVTKNLNFTGSGVGVVAVNGTNIDIPITGGSGSGISTIDNNGTALASGYTELNFGTGITATRDTTNLRYNVSVNSSVSGPFIDVTAAPYSADKTGANDSRVAINNAIDSLNPDIGGTIFFPAGTYKVSAPGIDASGVGGLILQGAGFGFGHSDGGSKLQASGRGYNLLTTNGSSTSSNKQGITVRDISFYDAQDNERDLNGPGGASPGAVYDSVAHTITFNVNGTTTAFTTSGATSKIIIKNADKAYNGRYVVQSKTASSITAAWMGFNPGAFSQSGGQLSIEPSVVGIKLTSQLRWKIERCSFDGLAVGININTSPTDKSDDSSWGHAEDNAFIACDVGMKYSGAGNFSTLVTGGNVMGGDDQVGFWFGNGSHQKIGGMKFDTSIAGGGGTATVGHRFIGILFEDNNAFEAHGCSYEMEGECICVAVGIGATLNSNVSATFAGGVGTFTGTNLGTVMGPGTIFSVTGLGQYNSIIGSGAGSPGAGFWTCTGVTNANTITATPDKATNVAGTPVGGTLSRGYQPLRAGNVNNTGVLIGSWARTASTNTLEDNAGNASSGSISQFGMQHNDTNEGTGIAVFGSSSVTILAPEFQGTGYGTAIDLGAHTDGCQIIGGHVSSGSTLGVNIRPGARNVDIIAFNREASGTHIALNGVAASTIHLNRIAVHPGTSVAAITDPGQ